MYTVLCALHKDKKTLQPRLHSPNIQCVSLDSASPIIYPEIKATEVPFQSWNPYLCSFYFRIMKLNWRNPRKHTVYSTYSVFLSIYPVSFREKLK